MPTTATPHPTTTAAPGLLGADAVLRCLEAEGVTTVFGMPGGAILPLYDALARGTTLRHVLARHEQGAGHMAQGLARVTGEPGVVFATSGPGATNLVTPIADADMDSTPLVCITGQVRSALIGTDAFQECHITGVVAPLVKRSWLVRDVAELPAILHEAFRVARSGRPGPVLVDIPRDVQEAPLPPGALARSGGPQGADDPPLVDQAALAPAIAAIDAARRPVLYVGGGAQGAAAEVRALAERAGLPVVTTLMGKGAFPESHELFCGWPGMHGAKWANWALHHADLVIAAGARFDDRVTGRLDAFAQRATVIHIDVDVREHGKIRHAEIPVHGALGPVCAQLARGVAADDGRRDAWRAELDGWRDRFPLRYDDTGADGPLKPQAVLQRLAAATADRDVVWSTGVGQHQMWGMQYLPVDEPRRFVTSGGHGTMGFGLPSALGAAAARPEATVVCVDGDGSFQMTSQELATAVGEGLPVIVVILNNGRLGMVSQWQDMFYDGRRSEVDLLRGMPDFAAIARGYGALGFTVTDADGLDAALAEALAAGRPAVLDVLVAPEEHCFPMIVPGGAAADMLEWPGTTSA